jgi:hypothetical protein
VAKKSSKYPRQPKRSPRRQTTQDRLDPILADPSVCVPPRVVEFQPVVRTVEPFALLDDYAADQRVALRIFAKRFEVEGTRGCALAKE